MAVSAVADALGPALIAVDFTATWLRIAMADEDGTPLTRSEWALPPLDDETAWSWEIGGRIAECFAREGHRRSALAIGVACPGVVDPIAGRLVGCVTAPEWDGLAVVAALRRHIDAPIVAVNRLHAALIAEAAVGAAADESHVLYVTLRGIPEAALLSGGRLVRGAHDEAGALPSLPELEPGALHEEMLQQVADDLANAVALVDPAVVVLDGEDAHVQPMIAALQTVLDDLAPGVSVVRAALGELGPSIGALRAASIVAFEGERSS